jgi:hypothetical protein
MKKEKRKIFNMVDLFKKNIYISDVCSVVKRYRHNQIVHNLIRDVKEVDSILEFGDFAEIIRDYKKNTHVGFEFADLRYSGESRLYGHLDMLYKYAGLEKVNYFAFPKVEHGVNPTIDKMPKNVIDFYSNFLYQGQYKVKQIHGVNRYKPVFSIGPYIHYAESMYSDDICSNLKNKWGKTLVVFPFHNFEKATSFANDTVFVDYVMDVLAKQFDTVIVSVYWNDVDLNLYKQFQSRGAILVSSGFRGDKNFIKRLKTIIGLSDCVCGNAFGTHIGYAMYLKKPFVFIDNNLVFGYTDKTFSEDQKNILNYTNERVKAAFGINSYNNSCNLQQEIYTYFWGGNNLIKSRDELRSIIFVGEEILLRSHGYISKFDESVKALLNNSDLPAEQLSQLRRSIFEPE